MTTLSASSVLPRWVTLPLLTAVQCSAQHRYSAMHAKSGTSGICLRQLPCITLLSAAVRLCPGSICHERIWTTACTGKPDRSKAKASPAAARPRLRTPYQSHTRPHRRILTHLQYGRTSHVVVEGDPIRRLASAPRNDSSFFCLPIHSMFGTTGPVLRV